jgi:hypothetical protein
MSSLSACPPRALPRDAAADSGAHVDARALDTAISDRRTADSSQADVGQPDVGQPDAHAADVAATDRTAVEAAADGAVGQDVLLADSSLVDGPAVDAAAQDAAAPVEACPDVPIPATCYNRSVIYREWGPGAVGDGTYFVDQAPQRLGFTRNNGFIWIVKLRLEPNTYLGRLTATGDTTPGATWISREPCSAADAFASGLAAYGNTSGGMLLFTVVRDDTDAETLRSDPAYAPRYGQTPQLRGGHCYYFVFENVGPYPDPFDLAYVSTSPDWCFDIEGNPTCWYLAMDFFHLLHDPTTGAVASGAIIDGLTQP